MQRVIEFQALGAATIKDTTNAWLGLRKILLAERALKWKERGNIFRECNGKNVQNLQNREHGLFKQNIKCEYLPRCILAPIDFGCLSLVFILSNLEKVKSTSGQKHILGVVLMKH